MGLYTKSELDSILDSRRRYGFESVNDSIKKALIDQKNQNSFDIFLSHSYFDKKYIYALKLDIESMGFSVYIDWEIDSELDRSNVTRKTADLVRERMKSCSSLFFAISPNSKQSKWMPWELGYFDGMGKRIGILPVLEEAIEPHKYKGEEYLSLYPVISKEISSGSKSKILQIHDPEGIGCYNLKCWLKL